MVYSFRTARLPFAISPFPFPPELFSQPTNQRWENPFIQSINTQKWNSEIWKRNYTYSYTCSWLKRLPFSSRTPLLRSPSQESSTLRSCTHAWDPRTASADVLWINSPNLFKTKSSQFEWLENETPRQLSQEVHGLRCEELLLDIIAVGCFESAKLSIFVVVVIHFRGYPAINEIILSSNDDVNRISLNHRILPLHLFFDRVPCIRLVQFLFLCRCGCI